MSTFKSVLKILLCLFPFAGIQAQFVNYGTDPARYKWNYVDLPHYKLIYPQGIDSMAYKYALYLENVYPHVQKSIRMPIKRNFPVILHPGTMLSNGMVAWTPRRMELMTTPSSRLHAQSWDKHLVLHESRHVIQTSKLMTGPFNVLYYLIGEQAAGVASVFSTRWFFEGDAVGTETAMSNSGRGRLPEFNMTYRAQMFSDKFYSFDKWYMGSYKDYTGDYYALGYDLTSYAKYRYGADIWDKVTSRYVSHFYALPPFSNAIKYHTKDNVNGLFDKTFTFLKDEWSKLDTGTTAPGYLSSVPARYTSYRYPQSVNDSTVIAVKSCLYDINSLVKITNGREERLSYLGSINSRIQLNNGRVYWSEYLSGLRWTHENYSVIKYYDLQTGQIEILTPHQRYLSPAIEDNGERIAASYFSEEGVNQIVLINAEDGKKERTYSIPENAFAKELTFTENGDIVVVTVNDEGLGILRLDTDSGEWTELIQPTSVNITSPVWQNGKLYFESGMNGTNNIYSLDSRNAQIHKITSARFGAFTPAFSADGKQLLFSDYQAKGYRVATVSMDEITTEKADIDEPYRYALADVLAQQEQFNLDSADLQPVDFAPKPYRKALHAFKIHSWAPFYYDVSDIINVNTDDFSTIVKPGATIISQNALNTAITQAGWYYKDRHHHGKFTFTYMGWFPVINLNVDYGGKAASIQWEKDEEGKDIPIGYYSKRNLVEAEARVYLPFNLTKNHYIRGIQPSVTYYLTNNRYQQYESREFRNFQYLLSELRFYNYRQMAQRDLLPRWGYQLRLQYLHTPFNTDNYGSLYAARLTTYWPGLIRNHGLMLRFGYQCQSVDDKALFIPKRIIDTPRGYDYLYQTRQHLALKADYSFSIACPDWSLGTLLYLKRIRSNLFYDYSRNQARKNSGWTTQSAAGADLLFDLNVIRMSYPLSLGVRLTQPIDYGKFEAGMLFSMSF